MKILLTLAVITAATQAKSVRNLAEVQSNHKYVSLNPRHTAEEWDAIYTAAEVNIPEDNTGLVPGTIPQPEDAGKVFVEPSERIITGTAASRGQIPWQALLMADGVSFSGGSLISTEWVLTAAHCLDGYNNFRVVLGSISRAGSESGAIAQNARQAIIHANYNSATIANDIALLRLTSAVQLSNYLNVVRLPRQSQASTTFAGSEAMVSGFGRINSDNNEVSDSLLYANVEIITNTECASRFGSIVQATNICTTGANGRSPCTGDSGGPLVVRESDGKYTEVGVVSFGAGNCEANSPFGFARVSKYLAWISSHTGIAIQP